MRVQKIIADAGYCSRRKAEELIKEGNVFVNGIKATIGDSAEKGDEILVNGKPLQSQKKEYLALFKPRGYVTALEDQYERTIAELLPEGVRVYPAGRLDKDAEGLLICTNDGDLANKIMHPKYHLPKTYIVVTYQKVPKRAVAIINQFGVEIKDGFVKDVTVQTITPNIHKITLRVGYHKVVKKIFDKFGLRVKQLTRISIGPVHLGKLKTFRKLTDKELKELQKPQKAFPNKKDKKDFKEAFKEYAAEFLKDSYMEKKKALQEQKEQIYRRKEQRFGRNVESITKEDSYQQEGARDRFERKERGISKRPFQRKVQQRFRR
jgi:23S rRNA pseudouridine2605 synthase